MGLLARGETPVASGVARGLELVAPGLSPDSVWLSPSRWGLLCRLLQWGIALRGERLDRGESHRKARHFGTIDR